MHDTKNKQKVKMEPRRRQSSVISTMKIKKIKSEQGHRVNQYLFERELGSGQFASVHLCVDMNTNTQYAVKKMNRRNLQRKGFGNGRSAYDCVKEELKILERLEHPNIIWLHEIIDDPKRDHIYLITEFHSRGSIGDIIQKLNKPNELYNKQCKKELRANDMKTIGLNANKVRNYIIDMIKALHYCHRVIGVIHRDIKPDNIMINHNDEAVLIDFGLGALVEETDQDLIERKMGSYLFFAPEKFARKNENQPKDET